jgi:hypothetical protein
MRKLILIFALGCFATSAFAQDASPTPTSGLAAATSGLRAGIVHVPLNEAIAGDTPLVFTVRNPQLAGAIFVHVVKDGAHPTELTVQALRTASGYEAVVPADRVTRAGFAYFVTERMPDQSERAVFADALAPHPVHVTRPKEDEDEAARLKARRGERSTVILAAEAVDYGDRRLQGAANQLHDRYYRLEAGYSYSFLRRVEEIRLTVVRVRGEAALVQMSDKPTATPIQPGIDYGRAEVTLLADDGTRLRGSLLLGASQFGFEYGGGAALVLGDPRDVNLELGVEHVTTLGTTGRLRLGFLATERVPMGASIEVSNFPVGGDAGVRLLYDIGYRFGAVTRLSLRGGYQGRTSVTGGPSLGANFEYGF